MAAFSPSPGQYVMPTVAILLFVAVADQVRCTTMQRDNIPHAPAHLVYSLMPPCATAALCYCGDCFCCAWEGCTHGHRSCGRRKAAMGNPPLWAFCMQNVRVRPLLSTLQAYMQVADSCSGRGMHDPALREQKMGLMLYAGCQQWRG